MPCAIPILLFDLTCTLLTIHFASLCSLFAFFRPLFIFFSDTYSLLGRHHFLPRVPFRAYIHDTYCSAPARRCLNQWILFVTCLRTVYGDNGGCQRVQKKVPGTALAHSDRFGGNLTIHEVRDNETIPEMRAY